MKLTNSPLLRLACLIIAATPQVLMASRHSFPPDSLDIKIGQMIMVGINERTVIEPNDPLLKDIQSGKAGRIILFEKNLAKENTAATLKRLIGHISNEKHITLYQH